MHLLGIDLGSSSVKVSLVDADTGRVVGSRQSPAGAELAIDAPQAGWAEQDPETWWQHTGHALDALREEHDLGEVAAIGVAYQMHGLVLLDEAGEVLRPSIIWCDSRAVGQGRKAEKALGLDALATSTLNSPGNFTASKLAWVAEHEPEVLAKAHTAFLPGDYIAFRLTGQRLTSESGLSEMVLWDFNEGRTATQVLEAFGLSPGLLPEVSPSFGDQGAVTAAMRERFGFRQNPRVTYRAGDQPNNAYSLNVLQPGEVAATAGTSGVVYQVTDRRRFDTQQRVNTFLHVNRVAGSERLGILLCLNGTGSAYSWVRRLVSAGGELVGYDKLNELAGDEPPAEDSPRFYPFGNGAERLLGNRAPGASFVGLDFARHTPGELVAAVQDGIAAALAYGTGVIVGLGSPVGVVRAGRANMFLSERFCRAFCELTGARLELYNTDGAQGAARAAGVGAGVYADDAAAHASLKCVGSYEPEAPYTAAYADFYERWVAGLSA